MRLFPRKKTESVSPKLPNYFSNDILVIRSLDGDETVLAECANPFLANFFAYKLNARG